LSNSSRKGSGFCCFVIDGNPLTSNPIVTGLTDPPAGFEHCTNLQLFDIEIDPEGIIYGGGTFGNPSNCWPGEAKRVNADTGERILPDIDASIEIIPVKFWFQRPDGPSVDNEENIYFNTWGCDEFANQVSCGVWKFEKGQQDSVSVFFAVNSFKEGDLLDPFGTPYDEFEDIPLIREGKGSTIITKGAFAGELLITAEKLNTTIFEGVYKVSVSGITIENCPIDPTPFIDRSISGGPGTLPEMFDVAEDSFGNIYVSAVGGGYNIIKYDSSGTQIGVFHTFSSGPRYMAFDLDDNLYLSISSVINDPDLGPINIIKITPNGTQINFGFVNDANGIAVE